MRVYYWRYDDGTSTPGKIFDTDVIGWHCWAYDDNDNEVTEWMMKNMKGRYTCIRRFNSGNPMHTIHITDPEDATFFKLTWLCGN